MNIIIGGIYEISREWHPYDMPTFNHMPAIVIDVYDNKAEIVLMGALQKISKRENQLMIEIEVNGKKHISAVACDVVHQIPLYYLKANIGYVRREFIEKIYDKRGLKREHRKNVISENNLTHDIFISNTEKFLQIMSNIEENTKKSRELSEKKERPFYIWKERFLGFVFGIIASIIANFLWESRFNMWDTVVKFFEWISSFFIR